MTRSKQALRRYLSPSLFALAALSFLLPFFTVSCQGSPPTTFTGFELVTRSLPERPQPGLAYDSRDCGENPKPCIESAAGDTALVAFVAALLGVVLGWRGIVRGPGWCALVGFGGLLLVPLELSADFDRVDARPGWLLATAFLLVVGLVHLRRAWRRGKARRARRRATREQQKADYDGRRWPRPRPAPHSSRT
jgi:hypothetical protein